MDPDCLVFVIVFLDPNRAPRGGVFEASFTSSFDGCTVSRVESRVVT